MKSEPLQIQNKTFLVNRMIQQAPAGTVIREFFKNAEENAQLAEEGNRRVEIYPIEIDGVRKLAFWNTGVGMDEHELRKATDISSSINKDMSLDGNFGIGAKVSGLTVSKEGIRYRSCKNGKVHEVIIGYDQEQDTYVRFSQEFGEGEFDTVLDITSVVEDEGHDTEFDWTEVVLFGESEAHDTVDCPLGEGKNLDRSFIPTTIFRRFTEFSNGVEVKIDVAMTKGGGKGETGRYRKLKTLDDVIMEKSLRSELVNDRDSGVSVRYIHDPKHQNSSHSTSARANPATASTSFCAIVYKGERYDFKTKKAWSAAAPNFGIPFGSKVLTIEIYIDENLAIPNQYRDGLTHRDDRSKLDAEYFADWVRELMPDWVRDIIKQESPEANDNLDDLQADLQRLLDEFRIPTFTQAYSRKSDSINSEKSNEGSDTVENTNIVNDDFTSNFLEELERQGDDDHQIKRANKQKVRKAPKGAIASKSFKALERVPEIKILTEKEDILEKEIKGRAGRFYKDAQAIFVNGLYSVSERMASDLNNELIGQSDPEILRGICLKASRRYMAFRVGKAVCYAISKRLADDWSVDDLEMATSPDTLSMAADDYKQDLSSAKRWAKEQIKLSEVEEGTVAA